MSVDLPLTEHCTARELAGWCSDSQLARAITYLELVRIKQINPGPEIERLLGENSLLTWTPEEVDAVQRRLALALCIKRELPYLLTSAIRESVFRHRIKVLGDFFGEGHGRGRGGTVDTTSGHGSRVGLIGSRNL